MKEFWDPCICSFIFVGILQGFQEALGFPHSVLVLEHWQQDYFIADTPYML
jgi:hypothetical protein